MTTWFLAIALAFMTVVCLVFGRTLYRVIQHTEDSRKYEKQRQEEIDAEFSDTRRYVSGITRTLNQYTGGISKRICESEQILKTLQRLDPDLFLKEDGLLYWLHANDQFLMQLASVAAEGIDRDHRRLIHEEIQFGRETTFLQAYEKSGLPPPVNTVQGIRREAP